MSKKGQEIEENFDNAFISSRKADNRAKLCILEQNIKAYKAASKNLKSQMNRCSKLEKEVNPHRVILFFIVLMPNIFLIFIIKKRDSVILYT